MSGEVPIETLLVILFIISRLRLPFWGLSHIPKFKNLFLNLHIPTGEKFMKLPHFSNFTFKNAH